MPNDKAIAAFQAHIAASRRMVAALDSYLSDHMDRQTDNVDYGDVGDAARVRQALRQIMTAEGLETEETEGQTE